MYKIILFFAFCVFAIANDDIFAKAKMLESQKKYIEAYDIYESLASQNHPESLLKLGEFAYHGKGIKQNFQKAENYFKLASNFGSKRGYFNLAVVYSSSKNKNKNYKKAFQIFTDLSAEGDANSQNRLGMCYLYGMGTPKDYKLAVKWFEASAKQKNLDAECNLAFAYASGYGVYPNFGRAKIFAERGYKEGNEICKFVWEKFNLQKSSSDQGFKFKNSFNQPEK